MNSVFPEYDAGLPVLDREAQANQVVLYPPGFRVKMLCCISSALRLLYASHIPPTTTTLDFIIGKNTKDETAHFIFPPFSYYFLFLMPKRAVIKALISTTRLKNAYEPVICVATLCAQQARKHKAIAV